MAMENKGFWIKFYQSFTEWRWYHDEMVKSLYIHCLLKAYVKDFEIGGEIFERGTFITSTLKLADELGTTRQKIRTALEKLVSTNEIAIKSTNKKTVIKVVNYTIYQDKENKNNQQNNQQSNHQLTNNQPTTNQQLTTDIDIKILRKKNNIYNNILEDKSSSSVETDCESTSQLKIDFDYIKNYWNEHSGLKEITKITDTRKPNVNARVKEHGLDNVYKMIDNISNSPFLKGESNRGFVATFDWCFKPKNFVKVLEGNYLDKQTNGKKGSSRKDVNPDWLDDYINEQENNS